MNIITIFVFLSDGKQRQRELRAAPMPEREVAEFSFRSQPYSSQEWISRKIQNLGKWKSYGGYQKGICSHRVRDFVLGTAGQFASVQRVLWWWTCNLITLSLFHYLDSRTKYKEILKCEWVSWIKWNTVFICTLKIIWDPFRQWDWARTYN